jgi:hypothetical protein
MDGPAEFRCVTLDVLQEKAAKELSELRGAV